MKMTRKELNFIVESYLASNNMSEALRHQQRAEVYIPKCDFDFNPEFLEIIDFVKAGGKVPASQYGTNNEDKPDFLNPLFLKAITQQFLPFMNMLVAPQFGLKTKCDTLQEMQNIFNEMYSDFSKGFKTQTNLKSTPDQIRAQEELVQNKIPDIHQSYFAELPNMLRRNNIVLTSERYSPIIDSPPSGFITAELIYASMILGNLSKTRENKSAVTKIVDAFSNPGRINSFVDVYKLCKPTASIPGYDKVGLKALFTSSSTFWRRNPAGGAMDLVMVTQLVFSKLKSARII